MAEAIGLVIAANLTSPRQPPRTRDRDTRRRKLADIPLSMDCKRLLAQAFWQAHGAGEQVGSRHILAAMLDQGRVGRLFRAHALDLSPLMRRDQQ
jgi:hypothetical protein